MLALILALAWGIRRLEDARLALFACCWMVLPIIPVLWLRTFSEGDIAHDRYLYFPSIGFVLLVSLFLAKIANHWRASRKTLQLAGLAVLALAYALGTVTQQTYWASDLHALRKSVQDCSPRQFDHAPIWGPRFMDAGYPDDAIALYSQVLAREPGYWLSNYNLGYTYYKTGKFQERRFFCGEPLASTPRIPMSTFTLA